MLNKAQREICYSCSAIGRYSLIKIAFLNELTGALAEDWSCL